MRLDIDNITGFFDKISAIIYNPDFSYLYYEKCMKEDLLKIKEVCIQNEEYEKVMIVNKMIENGYFVKEMNYDDAKFSNDTEKIMHNSYKLVEIVASLNMENTPIEKVETVENSFKEMLEDIKNITIKIVNHRINIILSRDVQPFNDDKYKNMFECFRSEAHKNYLNLIKEISNVKL